MSTWEQMDEDVEERRIAALRDAQATQLHRSHGSNPLFRAIPTGTYTYRYRNYRDAATEMRGYRDAGTGMGDDLPRVDVDERTADQFAPVEPRGGNDLTRGGRENEDEDDTPSLPSNDPVIYREPTAVYTGALTLLSKQPAIESPQTGAKGRAREREVKRPDRFMPSKEMVDAARSASYSEEEGYGYNVVDSDGYPRINRPNETLLIGCRPAVQRRRVHSDEVGKMAVKEGGPLGARIMPSRDMIEAAKRGNVSRLPISYPVLDKDGYMADWQLIAGDAAREAAENAPYHTPSSSDTAAPALPEKDQVNVRYDPSQHRFVVEKPNAGKESGDMEYGQPDPWARSGINNQPRRTANRGGKVGASVMSQEVQVEGYAGGKGRAREREERKEFERQILGANMVGGEDEDEWSDEVEARTGRRRVRWVEFDEDVGAATATMPDLPEETRRKYAADRPSRIWRDHSQEIAVERREGGGAKGRRREVEMKRAEEEERPRFMPSARMTDAARRQARREESRSELERTGDNGKESTIGGDLGGEKITEMTEAEKREAVREFKRHIYGNNPVDGYPSDSSSDETSDRQRPQRRRGRSQENREAAEGAIAALPEETRRKYAADRPSRIWRDHSQEIAMERREGGGSKGRRREVEMKRAEAEERPRFMPSPAMIERMREKATVMMSERRGGAGRENMSDDDQEVDPTGKAKQAASGGVA